MVIRDLHAFRAVIVPNETYSVLVVDSNAVLTLSAASQWFPRGGTPDLGGPLISYPHAPYRLI